MKKIQLLVVAASLSIASNFLYSPEVFSQNSRLLGRIGDFLGGFADNIRIRPNYQLAQKTYDRYGQILQVVSVAGRTYTIIVDCQQGLVSRNITALPQEQRPNFFRQVCGSIPQ